MVLIISHRQVNSITHHIGLTLQLNGLIKMLVLLVVCFIIQLTTIHSICQCDHVL